MTQEQLQKIKTYLQMMVSGRDFEFIKKNKPYPLLAITDYESEFGKTVWNCLLLLHNGITDVLALEELGELTLRLSIIQEYLQRVHPELSTDIIPLCEYALNLLNEASKQYKASPLVNAHIKTVMESLKRIYTQCKTPREFDNEEALDQFNETSSEAGESLTSSTKSLAREFNDIAGKMADSAPSREFKRINFIILQEKVNKHRQYFPKNNPNHEKLNRISDWITNQIHEIDAQIIYGKIKRFHKLLAETGETIESKHASTVIAVCDKIIEGIAQLKQVPIAKPLADVVSLDPNVPLDPAIYFQQIDIAKGLYDPQLQAAENTLNDLERRRTNIPKLTTSSNPDACQARTELLREFAKFLVENKPDLPDPTTSYKRKINRKFKFLQNWVRQELHKTEERENALKLLNRYFVGANAEFNVYLDERSEKYFAKDKIRNLCYLLSMGFFQGDNLKRADYITQLHSGAENYLLATNAAHTVDSMRKLNLLINAAQFFEEHKKGEGLQTLVGKFSSALDGHRKQFKQLPAPDDPDSSANPSR